MTNKCLSISKKPLLPNNCVAPIIITQPVSQQVNVFESATKTVAASGTNLKYQWRHNGLEIEGAIFASYSIIYAIPDNAGTYDVLVYNNCGSERSVSSLLDVEDSGGAGGVFIGTPDLL